MENYNSGMFNLAHSLSSPAKKFISKLFKR
uniref:Uncharacterized protein n=1 Tax=Rhizophora mucronata TaxID=61149 RepID=A0A2P2PC67_RHIMU